MMRPRVWSAMVLVAVAAAAGAAQERVSLDTLVDRTIAEATGTPSYVWLDDGTALLYDRRVPASGRTLERLDPASGRRTPAVDQVKALASWAEALVGDEEAPPALPWPTEVHPSGRMALYEHVGDLFLLDLPSASVTRLTGTPAEETNPRLSPDGRAASYVRGSDLYVWLDGQGERRLTHDGSSTLRNGSLSWVYWEEIFGREDVATWWSPDGTAIAFLQSDESGVSESVFPEFEPATPKVIRQRYPKAGEPNPTVRLGIVELAGGAITWVALAEPAPEYVVRVDWLRDSRRLAVQTLDRRQQNLHLYLVDRASGAARPVLHESSETNLNIHDDLRFLAGGERFLWVSERSGHACLYLYGVDGTLVRQLTRGPLHLRASSGVAWVRGGVVAVDEAEGWVYFTAVDRAPIAPALYRVRLAGGDVQRVSSPGGTHRVSLDPTGQWVLDQVSGFAEPPSLVRTRADGSDQRVVTPPHRDLISRFGLVTPTFVTIPAADGFSLPATVVRPAKTPRRARLPVILYVYGGPSAPQVRDAWGRDVLWANLLAAEGYAVVTVDNRSATGLSKTLEDTSYLKLMSALEVSDLGAAVRWLKRQPWVDPERLGVWGWSGGGTFTLQLMTHTREFKAGVAVAAVTDFRYYDTVWTERLLGLPEENPEGYRAGAPANAAKNLHGRLLLIHGTWDDNVHPQNAWRMARELQQAGVPFEMMIYPLEQHGIRGATRHVYQTMLEFWKRWL